MEKQGFTLLELSIVLVIIGLIIGGITVGADMIRSAELNAVVSDFQKYQTSVNTFKLKYNQLPGDMKNATDYWGSAHATPATCLTTTGSGTETCDGNGDGKIDYAAGANRYGETFTFWQHLANSEIISGNYTGIAGSVDYRDAVIGANSPESRSISGAGWSAHYKNNTTSPLSWPFQIDFGNSLIIGATQSSTPVLTRVAIFTPPEAYGIDLKTDDGKPAKGKISVDGSNAWQNCADGANATDFDADYRLDSDDIACSLRFLKVF